MNSLLHETHFGKLPELTAEPDFSRFWQRNIGDMKRVPLNPSLSPVAYPVTTIRLYDLRYDGADGTPVRGWYLLPVGDRPGPLPVILRLNGYSCDRALPHEMLKWTSLGYAVVSVDIRGQGGLTPDLASYPEGRIGGWMTQGITEPEKYYFKHVFLDNIRAIDFLETRPELDASRIGLLGYSQGGGMALAAAGLDPRPKLLMAVVPFLCHVRRAVQLTSENPFGEIQEWFRRYDPERLREDEIFRTLSYFDGMNHAAGVRARTLMAITMKDRICPPETVMAAFDRIEAPKAAKIYPDFGHDPLPFFEEEMLKFAAEFL